MGCDGAGAAAPAAAAAAPALLGEDDDDEDAADVLTMRREPMLWSAAAFREPASCLRLWPSCEE